jgi:putative methionine-R-sulfoxide reductase with GAF domain
MAMSMRGGAGGSSWSASGPSSTSTFPSRSRKPVAASLNNELDLVDVDEFLDPIGLTQYTECFMTNMGGRSGAIQGLLRHKLAALKICYLPMMGIGQFGHQKLIMHRVRQLDQIPSIPLLLDDRAPLLRRTSRGAVEVAPAPDAALQPATTRTRRGSRTENQSDGGSNRPPRRGSHASTGRSLAVVEKSREKKDNKKKLAALRRRNSCESQDSVTGAPVLSKELMPSGVQPEFMTGGAAASSGGRRGSFSLAMTEGELSAAQQAKLRAVEYGNNALKLSTLMKSLKELKTAILEEFRAAINCERATLMFLDEKHNELFFFDGDGCIRFPSDKGIAGLCITTGERLLVNDPYAHPNFNAQIDRDTGHVTRSILCEPVRSRLGGAIIAVLQMVNKLGNEGEFDSNDAHVLELACLRVSDALESRFRALIDFQSVWEGYRTTRRGSVSPEQTLEENIGSHDDGELDLPAASKADG